MFQILKKKTAQPNEIANSAKQVKTTLDQLIEQRDRLAEKQIELRQQELSGETVDPKELAGIARELAETGSKIEAVEAGLKEIHAKLCESIEQNRQREIEHLEKQADALDRELDGAYKEAIRLYTKALVQHSKCKSVAMKVPADIPQQHFQFFHNEVGRCDLEKAPLENRLMAIRQQLADLKSQAKNTDTQAEADSLLSAAQKGKIDD